MKPFILGFIFGAVGLYLLAMLALISPIFETIGNLLFFPGRYLAEQFAGSDGSTLAAIFLSLSNGVLYGVVFVMLRMLMNIGK